MKTDYKEPKLTYALDSSGKMVNIGCVVRGLACNCHCPRCNESLVAKLGHEGGRQSHFAHQKGSDCHGSYMTALHKLAEQIIEEEKNVMAPPYKEIEKQKLLFEQVEVEQRVERKDLQPDLVGVTSDGKRWFIEIRNTHEVDEEKKNKILESNITCLEIDVREQKLENLKTFLLESAESREWINNPIYENKIAETIRNKVYGIVSRLKEIHELQIDNGDNIHLKDLVASVSDDGLYATVNANSINEIPYLFHIGRHDVLEQIKPTRQCNELIIDIDKYPVAEMGFTTSNMERLYLYIPKWKRVMSIKEYRNDSQYDVHPKADCYSKCQYRPFRKNCIYQKDVVMQDGINYVVCNIEKKQRDGANIYSENQKPDRWSSSNKQFQETAGDGYEEVVSNSTSSIGLSPKQPHNVQVTHQLENTSSDKLPFERFWTVDDYYKELLSTNTYKTEKGISAEIVHFDKVGNVIIVLYKDPTEVRTYCPYHVSILSVCHGEICRNKVADFTNKRAAENSYYQRLNGMRNSNPIGWDGESKDECLPF